jgi:hypothetical protein
MLPAATQALPAQPPEGAAEEVRAGTPLRRHWIRRVSRLTATVSMMCRSRWSRRSRSPNHSPTRLSLKHSPAAEAG